MAAQVRIATREDAWNFGKHPHISPGEALMDLIASRHVRLEQLGEAIQGMVEEAGGNLQRSLTGETYITDANGNSVKVGEHVRALLQLESNYAAQLGQWSTSGLRAQIDIARERRHQEAAQDFAAMFRAVVDDPVAALTPEQKDQLMQALTRQVDQRAGANDQRMLAG
jgi:hypothetical protein